MGHWHWSRVVKPAQWNLPPPRRNLHPCCPCLSWVDCSCCWLMVISDSHNLSFPVAGQSLLSSSCWFQCPKPIVFSVNDADDGAHDPDGIWRIPTPLGWHGVKTMRVMSELDYWMIRC